jgi:hypothetical protein
LDHRETDILVSLAHLTLNQSRTMIVASIQAQDGESPLTVEHHDDVLIGLTDAAQWTYYKQESSQQRWDRFQQVCLSTPQSDTDSKESHRQARRQIKRSSPATIGRGPYLEEPCLLGLT